MYINTIKQDLLAEDAEHHNESKKPALLLPASDKKSDETDKKDAITKAFDSLARAASCKNVT